LKIWRIRMFSPEFRDTSVLCRSSTPAYRLQHKTRSRAYIYTLPPALQLWTLSSCRGGLRCRHVPLGSEPRFPAREGSGTVTCLTAPNSASPRGELQCCHVLHDSQRVIHHRNKEMLSCPRHAARLTCFYGTLTRYQGACKTCGHVASS
jgi:hypothetical protein